MLGVSLLLTELGLTRRSCRRYDVAAMAASPLSTMNRARSNTSSARRALIAARFTSLDQLAGAPLLKVTALHGVGAKALTVLQKALDEARLPRMR
jgi:hypothetical protein